MIAQRPGAGYPAGASQLLDPLADLRLGGAQAAGGFEIQASTTLTKWSFRQTCSSVSFCDPPRRPRSYAFRRRYPRLARPGRRCMDSSDSRSMRRRSRNRLARRIKPVHRSGIPGCARSGCRPRSAGIRSSGAGAAPGRHGRWRATGCPGWYSTTVQDRCPARPAGVNVLLEARAGRRQQARRSTRNDEDAIPARAPGWRRRRRSPQPRDLDLVLHAGHGALLGRFRFPVEGAVAQSISRKTRLKLCVCISSRR